MTNQNDRHASKQDLLKYSELGDAYLKKLEVPRCRNCKYFHQHKKIDDYDGTCELHNYETNFNEFCSFGDENQCAGKKSDSKEREVRKAFRPYSERLKNGELPLIVAGDLLRDISNGKFDEKEIDKNEKQ